MSSKQYMGGLANMIVFTETTTTTTIIIINNSLFKPLVVVKLNYKPVHTLF